MKNTSLIFPTTHLHVLQLKIWSLYLWPWDYQLLFVGCFFFFFNILHVRDHTVFAFLWFIWLIMMPTRSIHVGANGRFHFLSVQFISVAQLCPTLCDPMDCSTPDLPVHHQLSELVQTLIHWVSDEHPTISSFVIPFSSCLQPFPASGSFTMSEVNSKRFGNELGKDLKMS